jgi:hypothetical protein
MAKIAIGVGTSANDGTGDPIRTAFQSTNSNFTELYAGAAVLPFGMFSSSSTQRIANSSTAQLITFGTTEILSGLTKTSTSRFTIDAAGTYLITFSGIADTGAGGGTGKHIEIWLAVGGSYVANSNTRIQIPNEATEMTVAVSFLYTFAATNYFELFCSGDDTNVGWLATAAGTSPTRPACPSVIMTVNKISN